MPEQSNCFSINLLVVQIVIGILFTEISKTPRSDWHSVIKHALLHYSLMIYQTL